MIDQDEVNTLLFFIEKYRNLWVDYQTLKLCSEHPEIDAKKARSRFFDKAVETFLPVENALFHQQPLGDAVQDALQKL